MERTRFICFGEPASNLVLNSHVIKQLSNNTPSSARKLNTNLNPYSGAADRDNSEQEPNQPAIVNNNP